MLKQSGFECNVPEALSVQHMSFPKYPSKNIAKIAESVPSEFVEAVGAFGTIDECINKIEHCIEAGARHIGVFNLGTAETLNHYRKIIRHFESY